MAKAKRCVPGVAKWSVYAGGTACPSNAHGFSAHPDVGNYKIDPSCSGGRKNGYRLNFENVRGKSNRLGLHHYLGTFRSPTAAANAANHHCNSVHAGLAGARRRRGR